MRYLHRHPSEVDLPASALVDLAIYARMEAEAQERAVAAAERGARRR